MVERRRRTSVQDGLLFAAGSCFLLGTSVTVADVFLRSVTGTNLPAAIELTSLSIGLGALLSMPVCYANRSHVNAKLLSEMSPRRFRRPLGLLGAVVSVGFALLLLVIMGENTASKVGSPETTSDLGLSMPVALSVVTFALAISFVGALIGLRSEWRSGRKELKR
ncbi:TRAP-type C4-dicarboxylate transport system, small permease component [Cohaesibacter sp. ES.047]|uniref:TRAP transporter small permease n=1 Tax=Cohaesibacter sp. ES.047 TaxID=1798205 RepID=UPI000BB70B3E|nr:TRAP transporter small permease [Cohaesibacter sp. ES.047]SNY92394.1 TRAP-type C4-dicarboxylate transport system, small permease component [Cohaesibacter sp. ES.047]